METNHQQNGSAAVGLAFLQGALIGAIGALLLAPRSGRELRQQIKGYAQQTGEKGSQILREAAEASQRAIKQEQGRPS